MRRASGILVFVVCLLIPVAAEATWCDDYCCSCYYNWQTICLQDYPNGMPGNPDYCYDMYRQCLSYHGLTPRDCDDGGGTGSGDDYKTYCPLYINLAGPAGQREFGLTSAEDGVRFDINVDGIQEQIAWAGPSSTAALLVHPNPDGSVTSGLNLFGNQTGWPNGYEMLESAYDTNRDGVISAADEGATELWLWTDGQGGPGAIWDGVAQPEELQPFLSVVDRLWLNDRTSGYVDQHGNEARWVGRAQLIAANEQAGGNAKGRIVNTADWILTSVP